MASGLAGLIPKSMYQLDYHPWDLQPRRKVVLKPPPEEIKRSKYRSKQMDLEILQPFKPDVNVPFNLLHRRKRIFQVNPHDPIPNVKLEDKMFELKLKARRERPKIFMVPQISLDDVPEEIMYGKDEKGKGGLGASLYSSDWKKACEFSIKNSPLNSKKGDKLTATFEKKDLIDRSIERTRAKGEEIILPLEVGLAKYVPDWDNINPVEFVDTTKMYWEQRPEIGLCSLCDPQPAAKGLTDEEQAELEICLKQDVLRTPFALHPPGYTGYVPHLALGIQFRKKKFTKYDTFVTTSMEAQGVCINEEKK